MSIQPGNRRRPSESSDSMRLLSTFVGYVAARRVDAFSSIAWSRDGETLAVASEDTTVKLWQVATGKLLRSLEGHRARVSSVAWSPDGGKLASGSSDKTVKLWDVATGTLLRSFDGHRSQINSVAWSQVSGTLASGSDDGTSKLWEVTRGDLLCSFGHNSAIHSVAWSPDGKVLAVGHADGLMKLWPLDGAQHSHIEAHNDWIRSVMWSPDGRILASASDDKTVKLWKAVSGELLCTIGAHDDYVRSVAWSNDGRALATGSDDRTVKLCEVSSGAVLHSLEGHTAPVYSVCWSPDGKTLASGAIDGSVALWDPRSGEFLRSFDGHKISSRSIAWSPDSGTLAGKSIDSALTVWDMRTGQVLRRFEGHSEWVKRAAWSPDGKRLAVAYKDKGVQTWDLSSGELLCSHEVRRGWASSLAWTPDGKTLAIGLKVGGIRLLEMATAKLLRTFGNHTAEVHSVVWSPDGTMLASVSDDKTVKLWHAKTGKQLHGLEMRRPSYIRTLAWSPDGDMIAGGCNDWTVKLWRTKSGQLVHSFEGHDSDVYNIAWSSDSKKLATVARHNNVRLWSIERGACLGIASLPEYTHPIVEIRFLAGPVPRSVLSRTRFGDACLVTGSIGFSQADEVKATVVTVSTKVVLIGQSEVGKSCLALQLAEGRYETQDTTHAMKLWRLSPARIGLPEDSTSRQRREIIVWDLGGQREYRLVHQLFLHDTSLALMVFDPTRGSAAFDDVREWNLRLDKQRGDRRTAKLLVGTKLDDPAAVEDVHAIEQLRKDCGAKQYHPTSAKASRGIQELLIAIAAELRWESVARTTTPIAFQRVRDAVSRHQQNQEVVLLHRDLMEEVTQEAGEEFDGSVVDRIVRELCLQGAIAEAQLPSGRALLLQIGYVEQYAGSIILAAKGNPRGVPAVDEALLLSGQMEMPRMKPEDRLHPIKELVALQCVVQLLLTRNLAMRHEGMLVFPSEFASLSQAEGNRFAQVRSLYYDIAGAVDNIYASLVVKLAMRRDFGRARMAKSRSEYDLPGDVVCGVRISDQVAGLARIDVYFSEAVSEEVRDRFTVEVARHLQDSGVEVKEALAVTCLCGYEFDDQLIRGRIERGLSDVPCPSCERRRPILRGALQTRSGASERHSAHELFPDSKHREDRPQMHSSTARSQQIFISYAHADEPYKNSLVKHLSSLHSAGAALIWHDRDINAGDDWARKIDARLEQADIILLLISSDLMSSRYCTEIEIPHALERHRKGSARVIPVLIRNVEWSGAEISKLQALPTDARPVSKWADQDDAFVNVVQGIKAAIEQKMRPALADHSDQPLVWKEQPKPPIRILHLSDLHIRADIDPAMLRQPLLADIRELDFDKLDFLVISGDLTNRADEREFERVHQFLSGLLDRLELSAQRCIVVPGNHDLSWDVEVYDWRPQRKVDVSRLLAGSFKAQGEGYLVRDEALYPQRFVNFGKFYHQFRQEPYPAPAGQQFGVYLFEELGIQFIALNSACEIDDQFPKRSSIDDAAFATALESADDQIKHAQLHRRLHEAAKVLRLGVWHHPITGNEKIERDAFVGRLQKAGVKLCLHGHVHEDRTDLIGYYDRPRQLHVVGAGSFGAPVRARPESTPRLYNLLEVQRDHSRIRVHTRCLRKDGGAWEGWAVWPGDDLHSKRSYYDIVL